MRDADDYRKTTTADEWVPERRQLILATIIASVVAGIVGTFLGLMAMFWDSLDLSFIVLGGIIAVWVGGGPGTFLAFVLVVLVGLPAYLLVRRTHSGLRRSMVLVIAAVAGGAILPVAEWRAHWGLGNVFVVAGIGAVAGLAGGATLWRMLRPSRLLQ